MAPPLMSTRRFRALALGLVVVVGATTALLALGGVFGSESSDAKPRATATAVVARRDLIQRTTVSGTLGYRDARELAAYRGGTITSLPDEGRVLRPGAVLFRLDDQPVVFLSGTRPAWRSLALGVDDGTDVRQLEQNLRALGYDQQKELTIDRHFDSATASAVERWQAALGLPETGRIGLGDVVFLPGARRVGIVALTLGARVGPGAVVMTTTATTRLVTAQIDAGDQEDVALGDKVTIDLRTGTTTTGTITEVGKVASVPVSTGSERMSSGTPTSMITFQVEPDKPAAAGVLDQAPVDVGVTRERAKRALSVPVSALLALRGGRYGVEVLGASTTRVVEVTPGLYSDGGYVQITRGAVKPGDVVVVPT
jgi:peptidoglycan hydrolase-like protein with peptidoglycan-binding domain